MWSAVTLVGPSSTITCPSATTSFVFRFAVILSAWTLMSWYVISTLGYRMAYSPRTISEWPSCGIFH